MTAFVAVDVPTSKIFCTPPSPHFLCCVLCLFETFPNAFFAPPFMPFWGTLRVFLAPLILVLVPQPGQHFFRAHNKWSGAWPWPVFLPPSTPFISTLIPLLYVSLVAYFLLPSHLFGILKVHVYIVVSWVCLGASNLHHKGVTYMIWIWTHICVSYVCHLYDHMSAPI